MSTLQDMIKTKLEDSIYKPVLPRSTQYLPQSNQWGEGQKAPQIEKRKMRVTGYNATGNTMANGMMPTPNDVATSDRNIPLGTKIIVDGKKYNVGDRTNKRVGKQYGDTIDIYYDEPKSKTIKRGAPIKDVQIIKK